MAAMIPTEATLPKVPAMPLAPRWDACLELEYAWRGGRSVLANRRHVGPLRVQRDLYPEGAATCHTIVVHPPGGIAGGDALELKTVLGQNSAALLTTPGAAKWYRSSGLAARQTLEFDVADGAVLEWLPQESIVFDGAVADMTTTVRLSDGGVYLGWEILCFGRIASGERFATGNVRSRTEIQCDGEKLWIEQGRIEGGDPLFASAAGFAGRTVCATLIAAGREPANDLLAACRAVPPGDDALAGITRLPRLLIARYLGHSAEEARAYFAALWALLRPALKGVASQPPRIWAT